MASSSSSSSASRASGSAPAISAAAAAALAEARGSGPRPQLARDPSSASNPNEFAATHVHFAWVVDFERRSVRGAVRHSIVRTAPAAGNNKGGKVVFDTTASMEVTAVRIEGQETSEFTRGPENGPLGCALEVFLPNAAFAGKGEEDGVEVEIEYATATDASAIQWLTPAQTAGKEYPYVFTQCQAIHARSLFPCQDSPGAKFTFTADVTVPDWATALVSGLSVGDGPRDLGNGQRVFSFTQPVPISAYLMSLAVGQLDSREISPRCRVWSEPSVVEAAYYDFGQTEEFLQIAEDLTCEYLWSRYDLLCLPPSMAYGGMEHPCMTHVTPTLLAGDRSLAGVVAHEIAHSWTGNLITNETWESFWLNEGWTVWLERKTMARIMNNPRYFDFDAGIGLKTLKDTVDEFGADNPFTQLHIPLDGVDPDDSFSSVPYERGFNLLYFIEQTVGSERFQTFAHAYIAEFRFKTITSERFRDFVNSFFSSPEEQAKLRVVRWDDWLYKPGMPPQLATFDDPLARECEALADRWCTRMEGKHNTPPEGVSAADIASWSSEQKVKFLEIILVRLDDGTPMPSAALLRHLDETYTFTVTKNAEIRLRWHQLCIRCGAEFILPEVLNFLISQGRMKFVRPLYRALYMSSIPGARAAAVAQFKDNQDFYHPICRKMLAQDLGLAPSASTATGAAADSSDNSASASASNANACGTSCCGGMCPTGWVLTGLAVAAVVGIVLYSRRRAGGRS